MRVVSVPCAEPRFDVPSTVFVSCWPDAPCRKSFEYAIDNCTDAPIAVQQLLVGPKSNATSIEYDPPLVIAAGSRKVLTHPTVPLDLELGAYHVVAFLVARSGARPTFEASFVLADPARDKAKGECLARGDDWLNERCEKVMPDEGKPCSDERECEGHCDYVGEVDVPPDQKRVHGTCSRLRDQLGCHRHIGKTKGGLLPKAQVIPRFCAD